MKVSLLLVTVLAVLCDAGMGQLKRHAMGTTSHTVRAFSESGEVHLQSKRVRLTASTPSGRVHNSALFVAFDKNSGYFKWDLTLEAPDAASDNFSLDPTLHGRAIYVYKDGLVEFSLAPVPPTLLVQEWRERATSLEDAEGKSLIEAERQLGEYERGVVPRSKAISIQGLGSGFFAPKMSAAPSGPIKILAVTREQENFVVVVQGQWVEKFVLNNRLELIQMLRLE